MRLCYETFLQNIISFLTLYLSNIYIFLNFVRIYAYFRALSNPWLFLSVKKPNQFKLTWFSNLLNLIVTAFKVLPNNISNLVFLIWRVGPKSPF